MSLLRYMKIFGSSTGSIIEPTADGRLNTTVYGSTGNEKFTQNSPATVDFHFPNLDAFGRLRVSEVQTIFDSTLQYNTNTTFKWNELLVGGATVVHVPNESSVILQCGTASGDKVIRQSKRHIRYQAGKSQFVANSGVLGVKKVNVRQRIGIFDELNGLFFEQDENDLKVVRRTNVTGTPTDNPVNQDSWNLDKLDGTGISGITLDMSKSQIFIIDFQWLGVGRVRFGFDLNGEKVYVHEFDNSNLLTEVYMTTSNLPVRYEIENTGIAASATDLKQICSSVASEAGFQDERGITFSVNTGSTIVGAGTRRPILSIMPKTVFGSSSGIINRAEIIPQAIDLIATNTAYLYEVVYNGTLNSTVWVESSTNCSFYHQTVSTGITGGEVIISGFIAAATKSNAALNTLFSNKLSICNTLNGTTTVTLPDRLSIVMTSVGGSTGGVSVSLDVLQLS